MILIEGLRLNRLKSYKTETSIINKNYLLHNFVSLGFNNYYDFLGAFFDFEKFD